MNSDNKNCFWNFGLELQVKNFDLAIGSCYLKLHQFSEAAIISSLSKSSFEFSHENLNKLFGQPNENSVLGGGGREGLLNDRNLFSHSSGARIPRSRCQQVWCLLRPLCLACIWPSSLAIFACFFPCTCIPGAPFMSPNYLFW